MTLSSLPDILRHILTENTCLLRLAAFGSRLLRLAVFVALLSPTRVVEPVLQSIKPLNLGMYVEDENYELSILVDRACGGSSIQDGQLEIMLHRRILDVKGSFLGEALNETVCVDDVCQGLTVRGNYYMNINRLGSGAQWRRTNGQHIYFPVLLAFTYEVLHTWQTLIEILIQNYIKNPRYNIFSLK